MKPTFTNCGFCCWVLVLILVFNYIVPNIKEPKELQLNEVLFGSYNFKLRDITIKLM